MKGSIVNEDESPAQRSAVTRGVSGPSLTGCGASSGYRQRPRVSLHRLRQERPLQLRGDAAAGPQPGRAEALAAARRLLPVDHAAARPPDPALDPSHPRGRLPAQRCQTGESPTVRPSVHRQTASGRPAPRA